MKKAVAFTLVAAGLMLAAPQSPTNATDRARVMDSYENLPLSFEANRGQTDGRVKFLARGQGYSLFLTAREAVLALHADCRKNTALHDVRQHPNCSQQAILRIDLVHTRGTPEPVGMRQFPGISNYFIGKDPQVWHTKVPTYAQVKYTDVYRGIDLVYYGNHRQLEYDFLVDAGADPEAIALRFKGTRKLRVDRSGNLLVDLAGVELIEHAPLFYQEVEGQRQAVPGRYALRDNGEVGFSLGPYDRRRPLVIDPTLQYSTYLGGSNLDEGTAIAVDASGNAYVTGRAASLDFPTTPGASQTTSGGGGTYDAFVSKLNAAGSVLLYSTYLGGNNDDRGGGIAVNSVGNAYVTGGTYSRNFPTTPGALHPSFGGGLQNVFVSKLNAAGSALLYSTYLNNARPPEFCQTHSGIGCHQGFGLGVAVDNFGNAYVTGYTTDFINFPTTPGAFQTTYGGGSISLGDAFLSKLNAAGSALLYSTYLGGSFDDAASGIAVDNFGNAYVTGRTASPNFPTTPGAFQPTGFQDAFVTKLNAAGSALLYSTYLGGSGSDRGNGIAIDSAGNAYVTGSTYSADFPTTIGAFQPTFGGGVSFPGGDAFLSKLNAAGSTLLYSTYLGGSGFDSGYGIAIDNFGNAYVTGGTTSSNFPTTPGAFQTTLAGLQNAFVTKLNAAGSALLYSTYLGGSDGGVLDNGYGIAVDNVGLAYVTGGTTSSNFPTTPGAFQTTNGGGEDAFVSKLSVGILYQYDFFAPGTNTVVASFRFPGFVRDVSPASYPVPGFTGFIPPSPASLVPCNLTSNSSAELDCRAPTVHNGTFYFVFDYGAFPIKLGPFTGSGFTAPDGAAPSLGTVNLLNGQVIDVSGQP